MRNQDQRGRFLRVRIYVAQLLQLVHRMASGLTVVTLKTYKRHLHHRTRMICSSSLIIIDYQSKCYIVQKTTSTTNNTIAHMATEWFSILGQPLEIVADKGPQYMRKPYEVQVKCKAHDHITAVSTVEWIGGTRNEDHEVDLKGVQEDWKRRANCTTTSPMSTDRHQSGKPYRDHVQPSNTHKPASPSSNIAESTDE